MKWWCCLLVFVSGLRLAAQRDSKYAVLDVAPGYYHAFVITTRADTLTGDVMINETQTSVELQGSVNFVDKKANGYMFQPAELNAFGLYYEKDTVYFESVPNEMNVEIEFGAGVFNKYAVSGNRYFIQKISKGFVSLYYIRNARLQNLNAGSTQNTAQGTGQGGAGVIKIVSGVNPGEAADYFLMKNTAGKMILLLPEKLYDYFADCKPLAQKISRRLYNYKDMPEIILEYNHWKESVNTPPVKY